MPSLPDLIQENGTSSPESLSINAVSIFVSVSEGVVSIDSVATELEGLSELVVEEVVEQLIPIIKSYKSLARQALATRRPSTSEVDSLRNLNLDLSNGSCRFCMAEDRSRYREYIPQQEGVTFQGILSKESRDSPSTTAADKSDSDKADSTFQVRTGSDPYVSQAVDGTQILAAREGMTGIEQMVWLLDRTTVGGRSDKIT